MNPETLLLFPYGCDTIVASEGRRKKLDAFRFNHLKDLSDRSDRQNCFTFSDFLNQEEQSALLSMKRELSPFILYGGAEGAQRKMARFGDAALFGYEEDFPIACLLIRPRNQKFADALSHRDFLGVLMGLGIERRLLGDIVVRENEAYVFTAERIADFITEQIESVRHTAVVCERCERLPEGALFTTKSVRCIAASPRLDCVVGAVYHDSRSAVNALLAAKKIFVNDVLCENASYSVKEGDVISVRGSGKFIFAAINGKTKKDRMTFTAEIYQ